MITSFTFGQMVIGSGTYTADLIILPDRRIIPDWRRKQGHVLELADLRAVLPLNPDMLIVGTGVYDRMTMAPGLEKDLLSMGIELNALSTDAAATLFNTTIARTPDKSVSACFHLTC